ncbi:MAG: hypothetical protein HPY74_20810 [Firmicutes bacterium]|nr:hypothetical protein [Bacillota bacterium]
MRTEQCKDFEDMTEEDLERTLYPCLYALAYIFAEDYRRNMDTEAG